MARWIGLVALFMGLGMTTYLSARQGDQRSKPATVEQGLHTMAEGGGQMPPPRP
jgi:hypothetical protein